MPQEPITALIYVSTAAPGLDQDDLLAIQKTAQDNNAENNITGLLAFNGTNFMQLIEGDRAAIVDCALRIEMDKRHSGMTVLSRENFSHRQFPNWNLRSCYLDDSDILSSQQFAALLDAPEIDPQTRKYFISFSSLGHQK